MTSVQNYMRSGDTFPTPDDNKILVQLCFGLRRGKMQIFTDAIRASINEQLIQIYNSLFDFSLKCEVGIHSHPLTTTKSCL
ncbi:hypothetical protein V1477_017239 [Vespula maculifrons]|uniref:Uncharacterized protein n=1 Tax=Vespula maculifrons TaxID=7453 RepID=A0ABD2B5E9_VESMC